MTTVTFKLHDDEAKRLREAARQAQTTVSEFVRRQIREGLGPPARVRRMTCRHTGATIFRSAEASSTFSGRDVANMLHDFP